MTENKEPENNPPILKYIGDFLPQSELFEYIELAPDVERELTEDERRTLKKIQLQDLEKRGLLTPEDKKALIKIKRQENAKKMLEIRRKNIQLRKEKAEMLGGNMPKVKEKVRQGLINKAGLPAIKPLAWLKDFRIEYEISNEDLRRLCQSFIFGHSIDELKLMVSEKHSHEIPVIVYYFAKSFIADTEAGVTDAMEKLLDRIFGKTVQKEVVINANMDLTPRNDVTPQQRKAELNRLEHELRMLTGSVDARYNPDDEPPGIKWSTVANVVS